MAVPYALGEGTEQDRCVVDSLREAIRLKDSLYSKASVETLANIMPSLARQGASRTPFRLTSRASRRPFRSLEQMQSRLT